MSPNALGHLIIFYTVDNQSCRERRGNGWFGTNLGDTVVLKRADVFSHNSPAMKDTKNSTEMNRGINGDVNAACNALNRYLLKRLLTICPNFNGQCDPWVSAFNESMPDYSPEAKSDWIKAVSTSDHPYVLMSLMTIVQLRSEWDAISHPGDPDEYAAEFLLYLEGLKQQIRDINFGLGSGTKRTLALNDWDSEISDAAVDLLDGKWDQEMDHKLNECWDIISCWRNPEANQSASTIVDKSLAFVVIDDGNRVPLAEYVQKAKHPIVLQHLQAICEELMHTDHLLSSSDETESDDFESVLCRDREVWVNFRRIRELIDKLAWKQGKSIEIDEVKEFWGRP